MTKREKCKYPMSDFYHYKDEVPANIRVSTSKDCEECTEKDCESKYCLIYDFVKNKKIISR